MSVYRKFNRNDILFTTVHGRPRVAAKYGTNGWEGNYGPSASLSLYGGVRARRDVKSSDFLGSGISIFPLDPLDTHSIDKVIYVSGSYPSTGSIRFVRCQDQAKSIFQVTSTRWYEEHYRPISLLFDYYSNLDSNYYTGSTDFYSALLLADVESGDLYPSGSHVVFSGTFSGSNFFGVTDSWTAEAWVKPLPIGTSSIFPFPHYPTIFSQPGIWNMFLTDQGQLQLGLEPSSATASTNKVTVGTWNHAAIVVEGGVSASYWINGQFGGQVALPGPLNQVAWISSTSASLQPLVVGTYVPADNGSNNTDGLHGYIFETRIWKRALSGSEIQTLSSGTLIASASSDLIHYARFNDGPFGVAHGFASGSGAFDYSPNAKHGYVVNHSDYHQVNWQPGDHPTFVPSLKKANLNISDLRLVHVPSMFYGRQIDPGSVVISDGVYNKRGIVRVINDDGRGTLYISGSYTKSISGEEYTGEKRRKVGNVFYTEGLIVLTDPALWDVMDSGSIFWQPTVAVSGVFGDLFSVDFKGQTRILTKVFNCRLPVAQANASNNPTFSYRDDNGTVTTDDDRTRVLRQDGTTYITAIGLYNEDRKLIAVAKLAQPIRKREKDKINIRLKMDF